MATYLLVHGGWTGGWYWRRVARYLGEAGHEVYCPTLTGIGERAHLANPTVNLHTHVQDIVAVLEYEDLRNVVLVGHSSGGVVITAVAERAAERLAHLVYLDAFIPQDGESLKDLLPPEFVTALEQLAQTYGEGWQVPCPFTPELMGITNDDDRHYMFDRMTYYPLNAIYQTVGVSNSAAAQIQRTFIHCNAPATALLDGSAARARIAGWRFRELAAGHGAPATAAREIAKLLLEAGAFAPGSSRHELLGVSEAMGPANHA